MATTMSPAKDSRIERRKTIAANLIQAREQHAWSRRQFARILGITRQQLYGWEKAQHEPGLDNLTLLAEKLGIYDRKGKPDPMWFYEPHGPEDEAA